MALVAYDYSDDSDNNESDDAAETCVISKSSSVARPTDPSAPSTSSVNVVESAASSSFKLPSYTNVEDDEDDSDDEDDPIDVSFSSLPKPQYDVLYVDESKLKSSKSNIWKKLISLPRVNKATTARNKKSSYEKSNKDLGLLSMLPSPSTSTESTEAKKIVISNTRLMPTAVKNKLKTQQQNVKKSDRDDDENSDSETDFFSLSKVDQVKEYDVPNPVLDLAIENALEEIVVPKQPAVPNDDSKNSSTLDKYLKTENDESDSVDETNSNLDSQHQLDEEAVLKLCGRKRKGQSFDDVQVIDIHEDAILAETRRNLTKRLTEEVSYRPMSKGGPSTLSKRKHQITYLAYQAKERELELKNQWANNRFTKKQTQSKYGF